MSSPAKDSLEGEPGNGKGANSRRRKKKNHPVFRFADRKIVTNLASVPVKPQFLFLLKIFFPPAFSGWFFSPG